MALITCRDCGGEVSSTARACPKCGAQVPRTKWWLWVPLGLGAAFLLYGWSIPEYEGRAREVRNLCEKMSLGDPAALRQCDRAYAEAISDGKRAANAPRGPWQKPGRKDQLRQEVMDCWANHSKAKAPETVAALKQECDRLDYEFRFKFNVAP